MSRGDRQVRRGPSRYLLIMSVGALGVVYGDIGTSPLYAFREAFAAAEGLEVTRATVLGILSLIFWALALIVSIKYVGFVMRADNDGEGGILALTALILPTARRRRGARWVVILVGLFGTALLYGDGMITPAISVLSAVEGLEVSAPSLEPYVLPIAAVILVGLFSIQRRGTATVGAIFGPVMIVWFAILGVLGVHQIAAEPGVLRALDPTRAITFLGSYPRLGFLSLGAVFLVVTGSEALYADMGHFGRRPIRLGWFVLVLPTLVLNYFGQGALLIGDPGAADHPFFRMAPSWAALPLVVLATLATVIASQALISGAFSLTLQAVQLGYLPRLRIDHTSPREIGQIYVPSVNYLLMIACVGLVFAFRSSANLAAAYGVAVTTTMVITTLLFFLVARERWNWPLPAALMVTGAFLVVDLAFFGANILKVPAGGWFPLLVGAIVFTLMTTWKRGRQLLASRLRRGELPIERFVGSIVSHPQPRLPGTAVFLFSEPGETPPALLASLRHHGAIHERIALVSVQIANEPRVLPARRETIHPLGEGFFQIDLLFGFMEEPLVPAALHAVVHPEISFDPDHTSYFLGKESVVATPLPGMALWRERLFALSHRNATSAARYFGLPRDRVVEIGIQVEI